MMKKRQQKKAHTSNLIKKCFSQRRKTIKNNLKKTIDFTDQVFINCGINSKKRPEELDIIDFHLCVVLGPKEP